jgi:hypothetical protein
MKARKTALMKFGIGNRAAFLTHTSVAERAICLESPILFSAFDRILTRRRRRCGITLVGLRSVKLLAMVSRCGVMSTGHLGVARHGHYRCQASSRDRQPRRPLRHRDNRLL